MGCQDYFSVKEGHSLNSGSMAQFEQSARTLTAADAHGYNAITGIPSSHFIGDGSRKSGTNGGDASHIHSLSPLRCCAADYDVLNFFRIETRYLFQAMGKTMRNHVIGTCHIQ